MGRFWGWAAVFLPEPLFPAPLFPDPPFFDVPAEVFFCDDDAKEFTPPEVFIL